MTEPAMREETMVTANERDRAILVLIERRGGYDRETVLDAGRTMMRAFVQMQERAESAEREVAALTAQVAAMERVVEAARVVVRTGLDMGQTWECSIDAGDALIDALVALDAAEQEADR